MTAFFSWLYLSIQRRVTRFDTQHDQDVINHNHIHDNTTTHAGPSDRNPDVLSEKVPANATDLQSVDAMIASEMAKLSVDDREKVYLDIHGVPSDYVTETPELIHLNLLELQNEIELLPDKKAYNIAEKMDSDYVHDPDFRLAFLRCEKFDCRQAALSIVRHFQMKLDLFGVEKLVMEITQDDLDVDAMDTLHTCLGRFLKTRDRSGRIVSLTLTAARKFKTDSALRKAFYNIMATFRDADAHAQRNGWVFVGFYFPGEKSVELNPELVWKLPKREHQEALLKSAYSRPQQVRGRVHHGSVQECLEELKSYGIEPTSIPVNDEGELTDLKEERRRQEEQRRYERLNFPPRSTIHVPFSMDVLVGKGIPFQNHPGNIRLRELVSDHMKQYDKAGKLEKRTIAMEIIDRIKQSGGLFLKQDVGKLWSRVNDDAATLKVTATFRSYRQSQRQADN